ncbi:MULTISPECIES: hypothetical protein [unclassified Nocardia]|uniref:hypothetical protein n=1 Tax=unclassified Nocardia TaxID=2637762 RepID=UPI001CE3C44E|nr:MULTISPECIES: hypothetical protein [unclassified Nocardia]
MTADRDPTVNVDKTLHGRAKTAVRLMRSHGKPTYSMRTFTDEAFAGLLREIEITYHDGHALQPDPLPLERGRIVE